MLSELGAKHQKQLDSGLAEQSHDDDADGQRLELVKDQEGDG
jgi:hypothetical protein